MTRMRRVDAGARQVGQCREVSNPESARAVLHAAAARMPPSVPCGAGGGDLLSPAFRALDAVMSSAVPASAPLRALALVYGDAARFGVLGLAAQTVVSSSIFCKRFPL